MRGRFFIKKEIGKTKINEMKCVINKKRLTDVGETNYRKYQSKRQVRRMTKVGSYVRVRVHVCMYVYVCACIGSVHSASAKW